MKRLLVSLTAVLFMLCLVSCSAEVEEPTETETATEAKSEIVTSTTALNIDGDKSEELSAAISAYFENGDVAVEPNGSFVFEYNRDAQTMYANERDSETEQKASENAEAFVEAIKDYYPYDITLTDFSYTQIGSGDNGIDSVRYEAYYMNSQNQLLAVYLDSDAVISYVDCTLTW